MPEKTKLKPTARAIETIAGSAADIRDAIDKAAAARSAQADPFSASESALAAALALEQCRVSLADISTALEAEISPHLERVGDALARTHSAAKRKPDWQAVRNPETALTKAAEALPAHLVQLFQTYLLNRAVLHLADTCQKTGGPERFANALSVGLSSDSALSANKVSTAQRDLKDAFVKAREDLGKLLKPRLQRIFKHHDLEDRGDREVFGLIAMLTSPVPGAFAHNVFGAPIEASIAMYALCVMGSCHFAFGTGPYSSQAADETGRNLAYALAHDTRGHVGIEQFSRMLEVYGAPIEARRL